MPRSERQSSPGRAATRGFTLVELLVVLSIIGVLASIIFPVLARAKDRAYLTQCTSNARQIGIAVKLYMQDYGDYFPYARTVDSGGSLAEAPTLKTVLESYVENSQIWQCPSWLAEHGALLAPSRSMWRSYDSTYGYNAFPDWPDSLCGKSLSAVPNPAAVPEVWCASGSAHSGINAEEWAAGASGAVNVCYVDGHVKLYRGTLVEFTNQVRQKTGK